MTPNFFDPKRTQDVEMSCTWYEFVFYNKILSDPHYGCKLQCLGTIGADLTATSSRCLFSSIARESYDRLACVDGYDLSCRESDKHFNLVHTHDGRQHSRHSRRFERNTSKRNPVTSVRSSEQLFTFRSYECVRVLLDARANVNQQVGKLKAPLWTSLTSRHVFYHLLFENVGPFAPPIK